MPNIENIDFSFENNGDSLVEANVTFDIRPLRSDSSNELYTYGISLHKENGEELHRFTWWRFIPNIPRIPGQPVGRLVIEDKNKIRRKNRRLIQINEINNISRDILDYNKGEVIEVPKFGTDPEGRIIIVDIKEIGIAQKDPIYVVVTLFKNNGEIDRLFESEISELNAFERR